MHQESLMNSMTCVVDVSMTSSVRPRHGNSMPGRANTITAKNAILVSAPPVLSTAPRNYIAVAKLLLRCLLQELLK
jgi:hypothetical protein